MTWHPSGAHKTPGQGVALPWLYRRVMTPSFTRAFAGPCLRLPVAPPAVTAPSGVDVGVGWGVEMPVGARALHGVLGRHPTSCLLSHESDDTICLFAAREGPLDWLTADAELQYRAQVEEDLLKRALLAGATELTLSWPKATTVRGSSFLGEFTPPEWFGE